MALASRGPHHLALLAVLDPVAILEGLTHFREVDLLSNGKDNASGGGGGEDGDGGEGDVLEGLTRPRVVDLLSYRVAARQRRWRLAAYLCATRHS